MKFCSFVAVVSLLAASALAADINGKWKAEMPGRQGGQTTTMTFEFKADGDKITSCTVTNQRGEQPLSDCKLDGDQITFTRTSSRGDQSMKMNYKGKISGDEIKFTIEMQGGGGAGAGKGGPREFTAKKVS